MVCPYNGIIFGNKKEGCSAASTTCVRRVAVLARERSWTQKTTQRVIPLLCNRHNRSICGDSKQNSNYQGLGVRQVTTTECGVSFRGEQSVLKVEMVAQPCKCPKTIHVHWVNCLVCELYISKSVWNTDKKSIIECVCYSKIYSVPSDEVQTPRPGCQGLLFL